MNFVLAILSGFLASIKGNEHGSFISDFRLRFHLELHPNLSTNEHIRKFWIFFSAKIKMAVKSSQKFSMFLREDTYNLPD